MMDDWGQVQELFDEICLLDEAGRRRVLEERCDGNNALRDKVQRMVRAFDDERAANSQAHASSGGRRFGPWQTVSLIARGGMGEVWLGQRADGQHDQQAAIKILSPYLAGADSIYRFRRERELLARLEHPNIARLLDGGVSSQGEPYLVMEYVDGIALDRYCDNHRLSIRARLELMIKVCAAVNSAHQYLIVHRDLKPGNILVTEDGEPKLLDFGIAKMIDAESGRERTATVNLFLTPTYASPEILRGEPATVASDVYSLGVVLYQLLTGRRPFSSAAFPAAELERALRETAPERPSQVTEAAAEQRSTTPGRLRQALKGDLTTILEKTLEYDPSRRYPSADRLANDLKRYLSNRPILARPQTLGYRAAKFVSRHRVTVGLAALVLLGAAIGVISTVSEKRVAERRFEEVRHLAHYVLFDLYDGVSNLSGSVRVRAEMANRATDYLNTLAKEARNDRGLRLELAEGYLRLGDIQGNMFRTNLGDTRSALTTYEKGLDLLDPLRNDPGAVRLRTLIELHRAQATDAKSGGKDAFGRLRAVVQRYEKLAGNPPSLEDDYQLGQAYSMLGQLIQQQGGWVRMSGATGDEFDRAEKYLRRAVELESSNPDYAYSLAELLDRRAQQYASLQPQQTIRYDLQAVDVLNGVREPNRGYASFRILQARARTDLLFAYGQLNQFDAAIEQGHLAEAIYLPLVAANPEDHDVRYRLVVLRRVAGIIKAYAKRWNESAQDFANGIGDYGILLRTGPNAQYEGYRAELRMRMADDLWEAGRRAEAVAAAKAGLAELRALAGAPGAKFGVLRQTAQYLLFTEVKELRDPKEALALAERGRARGEDPFSSDELLAGAYAANHRYRDAVNTIRRGISELPPVQPGEPPTRARRSSEASLAEYERQAKAAGQ